MAAIYLFPVTLGETPISNVLPSINADIMRSIRHFIVEDVRSARRFIRQAVPDMDIDTLTFYELNKHTPPTTIPEYLKPAQEGHSMGVLSEAGCPAIADPGSDVVRLAHQLGIRVIPLVGPSSIILSLMASGFNGQGFAFNGYLPIEPDKRIKQIRLMEARAYNEAQTQIFIETPYRNGKLVGDLLRYCQKDTLLCIAADITCPNEFIETRKIKDWDKHLPDLNKRPCIFLLYKGNKPIKEKR